MHTLDGVGREVWIISDAHDLQLTCLGGVLGEMLELFVNTETAFRDWKSYLSVVGLIRGDLLLQVLFFK